MLCSARAPLAHIAHVGPCLLNGALQWASLAWTCLELCKAFERRLSPQCNVLRQFDNVLSHEILGKLEDRGLGLDQLWDMEASEIGSILRFPAAGAQVGTFGGRGL